MSYSSVSQTFFEVGTTSLSQNSSADHLTLALFESNFVAYFNTSVFVCNLAHTILDVQYVPVSMCRLGVGKIIKNATNT